MSALPYLTFDGNCREAMNFYKKCLGAELVIQTLGQSPLSRKMPAKMKNCIVHATLIKGQPLLMGTDMVSEQGLRTGNKVSISLQLHSEKEIKACYTQLLKGGVANHVLGATHWHNLFGELTDKFGNHWLLHYK